MTNRGRYQDLADAMETHGAPCADIPEIFFPEDFPDKGTREQAIRLARALCATCPIRWQCFEYAVEAREPHGIWGGTLPHER